MYEQEMATYQEEIRQMRNRQNPTMTREGMNSTAGNRRKFMSQAVNRRRVLES